MSRKLHEIPDIPDYNWIRRQMAEDLSYRLQDRQRKTSLGRPLYERINVQVILTQECPYHCPFCMERQNPMTGQMNFTAQRKALEQVLEEHPQCPSVNHRRRTGFISKADSSLIQLLSKEWKSYFFKH